jgi:hypothetical protein
MLKQSLALVALVVGCSAEVVKEDPTGGLRDGEGGYLGTGASDREGAVREACDELVAKLPNCDHEVCTRAGHNHLENGELSGCEEEAVDFFYCLVDLATKERCLGHHACEQYQETIESCLDQACAADPEKCIP